MSPKPNLQKMIDISQNNLFLKFPGVENILNLGAADGNFCKNYPWIDVKITNVDNNSENNVFGEYIKETSNSNIKNVLTSCTDLSMFKDDEFDLVVFTHLIEHLTDEEIRDTISGIKRVLKNDGHLIVSTPNIKIRKYFGRDMANRYHIKEYEYNELKEIFIDNFKFVKEYGAFWVDINTGKIIPSKNDDAKNSYVIMIFYKNDK